jgi:hypothetical protein
MKSDAVVCNWLRTWPCSETSQSSWYIEPGQLGSGLSGFSWEQNIYSGQGDDWEDEVDAEVRRERKISWRMDLPVKFEVNIEVAQPKRRTRIVKRLLQRPKTVPCMNDFQHSRRIKFWTWLRNCCKGFAVKKSGITKKSLNGGSSFVHRENTACESQDGCSVSRPSEVTCCFAYVIGHLGNFEC